MTTIKLKNGSGAPTSGDLAQGEPALDLTNKRLYTEDSGGTVIEVGTNPGVDVTFADNRKAVFGAGSDLQIYHDGTHSRVVDAGTGNLNLQGDNLRLKTADAVGTYLEANNGGAVTITYNSSPKLATTNTGIDVTGSISADGLTVGDNEFFLAGAGGDLKIGHDGTDNIIRSQGPSLYIDANNHIFRGYSPYTEHMRIDSSGLVAIGTSSPVSTAQLTVGGTSRIAPVSGNGLLLASGGSDRMFISTAGNVGIGTSSPTQTLHLKSADPVIRLEDSSPDGVYAQIDGAGGGLILSADGGNGSASSFIGFRVDGTASGSEKMRIDSSGNVGIGVTSLVTGSSRRILQVSTGSDGGQIAFADSTTEAANPRIFATNKSDLKLASANSGASTIQFITGTTTPAERMRIDSSGNVGIGTSSPDGTLHVKDAVAQVYIQSNDGQPAQIVFGDVSDASRGRINYDSSDNIIFENNNLAERMRIDASGNLLVGTTNVNPAANNVTGHALKAGGLAEHANSGAVVMRLNRTDSDGDILQFYKGTGTVGSIGTNGGDLFVGTGDTNILFADGSDKIMPATTGGATRDAAIDLGTTGGRFKHLYLSGAVNSGSVSVVQAASANMTIQGGDGNSKNIVFAKTTGGTQQAKISAVGDDLRFTTGTTNEAMRIDSSRNLLVGKTSTAAGDGTVIGSNGVSNCTASGAASLILNRQSSNGDCLEFRRQNVKVGSVSVSGTNATFNTSSDQRLKDNIVDAPSASDDIDAIQVRSFDWKTDGSHQKYGMVAQELQSVAPEAVSEGATEEDMMGVDYSKLVPMLVKEIQSLRARVAQLETN